MKNLNKFTKLSGFKQCAWFVLILLLSTAALAFAQEKNNEEKGTVASVQERTTLPPISVDNIDSSLYVPNQIFVKFRDDLDNKIIFNALSDDKVFEATASLSQIARDYKVEKVRKMFPELARRYKRVDNIYLVTFANAEDISGLIKALRNEPWIVYAEPVPIINTYTAPNDPAYTSQPTLQWSLPDINAQAAWDIYEQNPSNPVVVAVVDDAVKLDHQDLQANIWVNPDEIPNNGIDDDNDGYIDDINGYDVSDFQNLDNDPNPPATATNSYFMHGTHVAGIIAAVTDNNLGIASISRNHVKIMAVKVKKDTNTNPLSLDDSLSGLAYAIMAGADIINMSFGMSNDNSVWEDMCTVANEAGIVLVAAAGNTGTLTNNYPASCIHVISVGAVSPNNLVASYSTYNSNIDVMAPGTDIYSTLPVNNSSYGVLSGTSMASPLAAGLCGLMLSYNPNLTPQQVEIILEDNCIDITGFNPSSYAGNIGAGKINASATLAALAEGDIPDIPFTDISASFGSVYNGVAQWGDYDNDGDLDILLTGSNSFYGAPITRVYRNDGNGVFTDIDANLTGITSGNATWGDYDNDGYLDILLVGMSYSTQVRKIYHNNGNDTFTNIGPVLCVGASGAWGDYDNDGRLDVLICEYSQTTLYHNANGTFTDSNINFQGSRGGIFGDYDNDGDLDILLFGESSLVDPVLAIYRNDGNGVFTNIEVGLQGIHYGNVQWGDYDNDGYLDILCTGEYYNSAITNYIGLSKIYHNNGDGSFTDINAGLSNADAGIWGDYDNDGDLDILLAGYNFGTTICQFWPLGEGWVFSVPTRIYNNNNGIFTQIDTEIYGGTGCVPAWGDYDNDGDLDIFSPSYSFLGSNIYKNNGSIANVAPAAPTGLSAVVDASNNVTFSWNAASDNETPEEGFTYNLVIGISLGGVNILSPMSQVSTGWRRVVTMGGQDHNTSWTIKDLIPGIYYWGVQAVDSGFMGSPFSVSTVTVANDVNLYTISGMIYYNNVGLGGVTVSASGVTPQITTNVGEYSFIVPEGWSGTVTPSITGYTFSPISQSFNNITQNQTQDFVATANVYTVSGTVLDFYGQPIPGATVNGQSVASGNYSFNANYGSSLTLTPQASGYNFAPATQTFNNIAQNETQNFVGHGTTVQTIHLTAGWNIISFNVMPENPNLVSVFAPILNSPVQGNLLIVKDGTGMNYWPQFELNNIGNIALTQGYQVKVLQACDLVVVGVAPQSTTIYFPHDGWYLMGYPTDDIRQLTQVLAPLIDNNQSIEDDKIVIVKNGQGYVYWPQWNLNNIVNMKPGQGYQIKLKNVPSQGISVTIEY